MNMLRRSAPAVAVLAAPCLIASLASADQRATATLRIFPLTSVTAPVGTTLFWTAGTTSTDPALFRFSVAAAGDAPHMLRDFSPNATVEFTPLAEGEYQLTADADVGGVELQATRTFTVTSRVTAGLPVVSPTAHPLVALYSAPPCEPGSALRVAFWIAPSRARQYTPWSDCRQGRSVNLYVGGLAAANPYMLQQEIASANGIERGPVLTYTAGAAPADIPKYVVIDPPDASTSFAEPLLLYSRQYYAFAVDLQGRVVWFYNKVQNPWQHGSYLLRPVAGGTFLMVMNDTGVWRVLREIDMAGNAVRETSTSALNIQLAAMGQDPITAFHHDGVRLPNGHTLVVSAVERLLTDVQGPGTVDVLGDMLIDLDPDWHIAWVWNSFDHLDPRRAAVLAETCSGPSEGCPPVTLAPRANDWLHTNSIDQLPDGNLLLSQRNQDWLIKIDYRNGAGTGDVIWRLGPGQDFTLVNGTPGDWFTHQHSASMDAGRIALYDNGNTRCIIVPDGCDSRGQVWTIDETNRTARPDLNVDLGNFSAALGSAQRLSNGDYHFLSGLAGPNRYSQSLEVTPDGTPTFLAFSETAYRSFRMRSLYRQE